MKEPIIHAIEAYKRKSKDKQIYYFQFTEMTPDMRGCREHPNADYHRLAAKELGTFLLSHGVSLCHAERPFVTPLSQIGEIKNEV